MKKRVITFCFVMLFTMLLGVNLAACGSSADKSEVAENTAADFSGMENASAEIAVEEFQGAEMNSFASDNVPMIEETGEKGVTGQENSSSAERKLIRNVELNVETKEFDVLLLTLETQITEAGGYIEHLDSYGSSNRSSTITARIPADKLDGFVKKVGEAANVTGRSESVEDVTLQYVDLDSHVRMLKEEQERLLELLETASTIEDMIAIESRLGEVRYQLESMQSQLRVLENQVDYSTVHIYIDEVVELTPAVELTDGERITQGFLKSAANVLHGIREFGINLLIYLPYIIVGAVVIALILLIIRIFKKLENKRIKHLQQKHISGEKTDSFVQKPDALAEKEKITKQKDQN